ncbi:MAG: hypothetical protein PHE27_04865 [Alphaproteobacteria bacterium]|nr:hypothetical protein [Alphaproteobacteria bacterium]
MTPKDSDIQEAVDYLTSKFPGLTPKEILTGPLAKAICGPLPGYSKLTSYEMTDVTTATVGAFVICYAYDPAYKENVVILIERGKKGEDGKRKFGITGGYIDLDEREQPCDGAARELREELLDDKGAPILEPDPKSFEVVSTGVGYRYFKNGGYCVQYNGLAVELSKDELGKVHEHVLKLRTDPLYKHEMQKRSGGEVSDVFVLPISQVSNMRDDQFEHVHELEAVKKLHRSLGRPAPCRSNECKITCGL